MLAQVVAALIVVGSGIGITFIPNPVSAVLGQGYEVFRLDTIKYSFDFFGTHSILILADLFALFWIVWVINMGFIDCETLAIIFWVICKKFDEVKT